MCIVKENNDLFFLLGLASLAMSLFLLPLSLYLLPQVLFDWNYSVPMFILNWNNWLQDAFSFSLKAASWTIFYTLFLGSLIFAMVAYMVAPTALHYSKKNLPHEVIDEGKFRMLQAKNNRLGSIFLLLKLILVLGFIFLIAVMVQWLIAILPSG